MQRNRVEIVSYSATIVLIIIGIILGYAVDKIIGLSVIICAIGTLFAGVCITYLEKKSEKKLDLNPKLKTPVFLLGILLSLILFYDKMYFALYPLLMLAIGIKITGNILWLIDKRDSIDKQDLLFIIAFVFASLTAFIPFAVVSIGMTINLSALANFQYAAVIGCLITLAMQRSAEVAIKERYELKVDEKISLKRVIGSGVLTGLIPLVAPLGFFLIFGGKAVIFQTGYFLGILTLGIEIISIIFLAQENRR
ncbi:MAG: hypothetical protein GF364_06340 [Candidatus Lokiarchaeota archaeon]|nr:hypothetical protein [Candidatus Lokiarchaeota archaeon]